MIDLVCIDVDGTLIGSSGEPPESVWPAAEKLRAVGVRLALCSGRPAFGVARGYAERLDPEGWHVFQNGSSIVDLARGRSRSAALPRAAVETFIARARETERALELYADDEYAVERDDAVTREHARLLGVPFALRRFDELRGPVVRAQWLLARDEAASFEAAMPAGLEVTPSTSPVMPDTIFLMATAAGVSKASAVRKIAADYGAPLANVMMVGDGHNDVGVLREVGHPVAMGNAEGAVRALARYTVRHVDEGGLVDALEIALATRALGPAPGR